ncbi:MAG: DUF1073 domain-containing protein, partial [Anaerolineales bacterium]
NLLHDQLLAKYQRQDLAARVVDMPPEEMWSHPPTLKGPEKAIKPWEDFVKKMGLWDKVIQADKLCSFGEFSVLWVGTSGSANTPTTRGRDLDDFLYVQAYGGQNVEIKTFENDPTKRRYGQPLTYQVTLGPRNQIRTVPVSHTRIVHIVDRPLQGLMLGEPRLAQVYNVLDDLLKTAGGSAELYWLTANRGMQVDVDKDMELNEADATALADELDEFQHQLRRFIRTRGVQVKSLGADATDPRGVFQVLLSVLSGATSIPQRILIGSEAGQLASEQDRANWAEYINRRRAVFGEPFVLKPIIKYLEGVKYLDEGTWEKAEWKWPESFHMSPLEEGQTMAAKARAVANLSRRNQFNNPLVTDEEVRIWVGLPEEVEGTLPVPYVAPQPDNTDPNNDDDNEDGDNTGGTGRAQPGRTGGGERSPTVQETLPGIRRIREG